MLDNAREEAGAMLRRGLVRGHAEEGGGVGAGGALLLNVRIHLAAI
jgi:hypothetical protein